MSGQEREGERDVCRGRSWELMGRCWVCVCEQCHSVTAAGRRAVRGGGTAHTRAARLSQALPNLYDNKPRLSHVYTY
jgi:hypothetical protein